MEDVPDLYAQPPTTGMARLCFDERPCQLPDHVMVPLLVEPDKVAKEDNEYVREGTCVVLPAYDLDTGQRYTQVRQQRTKADYAQVRQQRTKADYAQFMQEVVSTHYANVMQL